MKRSIQNTQHEYEPLTKKKCESNNKCYIMMIPIEMINQIILNFINSGGEFWKNVVNFLLTCKEYENSKQLIFDCVISNVLKRDVIAFSEFGVRGEKGIHYCDRIINQKLEAIEKLKHRIMTSLYEIKYLNFCEESKPFPFNTLRSSFKFNSRIVVNKETNEFQWKIQVLDDAILFETNNNSDSTLYLEDAALIENYNDSGSILLGLQLNEMIKMMEDPNFSKNYRLFKFSLTSHQKITVDGSTIFMNVDANRIYDSFRTKPPIGIPVIVPGNYLHGGLEEPYDYSQPALYINTDVPRCGDRVCRRGAGILIQLLYIDLIDYYNISKMYWIKQ